MLQEGIFLISRKKVFSVQNESRNVIKNYRRINLVPIFSKIRIMYNSIFNYFKRNKLFTDFQDLYQVTQAFLTNYLLLIKLLKPLIVNPNRYQKTFPEVFKTFYKVWHENLFFKYQTRGIRGN